MYTHAWTYTHIYTTWQESSAFLQHCTLCLQNVPWFLERQECTTLTCSWSFESTCLMSFPTRSVDCKLQRKLATPLKMTLVLLPWSSQTLRNSLCRQEKNTKGNLLFQPAQTSDVIDVSFTRHPKMLCKEFISMWSFWFNAICIFLNRLEILTKIINLCYPGIFFNYPAEGWECLYRVYGP